jgi:uncharacterized protein YjbI with pentapeptide repeats
MDQAVLKRIELNEVAKRLAAHSAFRRGTPGGKRAVFDYCDLSGFKFIGLDLVEADFTGAKLDKANFTDAKLSEATFFGADLRCAKLIRCDLRRADMRGALVHGADLTDADLSNADLREGIIARRTQNGDLVTVRHDALAVNVSDVSFRGSNLSGAKWVALLELPRIFPMRI